MQIDMRLFVFILLNIFFSIWHLFFQSKSPGWRKKKSQLHTHWIVKASKTQQLSATSKLHNCSQTALIFYGIYIDFPKRYLLCVSYCKCESNQVCCCWRSTCLRYDYCYGIIKDIANVSINNKRQSDWNKQ